MTRADGSGARIVASRGAADAEACARIMSGSEPWLTLGRDFAQSLAALRAPGQELWIALDAQGGVGGFVLLVMQGALVGYIRSIAVREDLRSHGVGRALLAFIERRVHRESPNVFLCVSSFNPRARALYERAGFQVVGELCDFIVPGHSEWLMRKTIGPISGYVAPAGDGSTGESWPNESTPSDAS